MEIDFSRPDLLSFTESVTSFPYKFHMFVTTSPVQSDNKKRIPVFGHVYQSIDNSLLSVSIQEFEQSASAPARLAPVLFRDEWHSFTTTADGSTRPASLLPWWFQRRQQGQHLPVDGARHRLHQRPPTQQSAYDFTSTLKFFCWHLEQIDSQIAKMIPKNSTKRSL